MKRNRKRGENKGKRKKNVPKKTAIWDFNPGLCNKAKLHKGTDN